MLKVLIAEDDRVTARILERHIQTWGYQVIVETNGEDAWQTWEKEGIQIVIVDWMMPKLDGLQLCEKIRNRNAASYSYVILLTARASKQDIVTGLTSGADDYITKPVDYLELKARLATGKRIIELENKNRRLQKRLEMMAKQDSLTGFWNKMNITQRLEEELSRGRRDGQPISTLLIDIDNFKQINDTYGHQAGDDVLTEVASRLRNAIRRHDQIGRYGGDEILIVLWKSGKEHLQNISDRLCRSVSREQIQTDAGPVSVTISVGGISSDAVGNISASDMIRLSDQALYQAKKSGRNRSIIMKAAEKEEQNGESHASQK